jgi:hypothetical protein
MLDRAYQREILMRLRDTYPARERGLSDADNARRLVVNVAYLAEHGLVDVKMLNYHGQPAIVGPCKLTAAGMDFLEDDGGLTATLSTVTIRLDGDQFRQMLATKIESALLPAAEKTALMKHVGALSQAGLQEAGKQLMQMGLKHIPDAAAWLRSMSGL